jgi:hypothetical protein
MKKPLGDSGTPIDREDRDRIADAIERYLSCEIDNFQLDDILLAVKDRAAYEIAREVWFFYDGVKKHKNEKRRKITEQGEALFRRWIQFLRSDREWPIQEPDARIKWYHRSRWKTVAQPVGCLVGLILLPWGLFEVIVLGRPRPRFTDNEYWPFQSSDEWTSFAVKNQEQMQ